MQDQQIAAQFFGMFMEARDGVPREVPGIEYADLTIERECIGCLPAFYQDADITQEIPAETMSQVVCQRVAS